MIRVQVRIHSHFGGAFVLNSMQCVFLLSCAALTTLPIATGSVTPTATGVMKGLSVSHTFTGNVATPYCIYDWGDNDTEIKPLSDYVNPDDSTHDYTAADYYSVHIICVTHDDVYTVDNDSLYVGDSISGFSVSNSTFDIIVGVPWPVSSNVVVGIQFSTGTHVDIQVTTMETGDVVSVQDYDAPGAEFITLTSSQFTESGLYGVEVNATNPISGAVLRHFVLAVEEEVDNVVLSSTGQSGTTYYFLVNHDHVITTSLTAENPVFTWWLEDDATLVDASVEACDGTVTSNSFTIQHTTTGTFQLTQVISNHVNSVTNMLNVSFYHIVNNFTVSLNKDIAFYNDNIVITIDLGASALLQMGVVQCEINEGDGTRPITKSFDLTADDYGNLTAQDKQQATDNKQFNAGWYYPTVVCSNGLPDLVDGIDTRQTFDLFLIIVNPVDNLVLSNNSPNISNHPLTIPLELSIDLSDGSDLPVANVTCVFTYSDANSPINTTGDITFGNPLVTTIPFSLGDKHYNIQWNCSNELSHMADSLDVYVFYDCWKQRKYFDDEVHNSDTPRVSYTNEPYLLTGDVQLKTPAVCDLPVVSYFTVYKYNINNFEETLVENITNPDSLSSHTFPADKMQPVLHKIYLYTTFPQHTGQPLQGDYLFVEFILPDLRISIVDDEKADNNKRRVIKTKNVVLDSYKSMDPAKNLSGVALTTRSWTCQTSPELSDDEIETYFFSETLQSSTVDCSQLLINNGGSTDLEYYSIPGEQFVVQQWYVFKLVFASGGRSASKSVAIITSNLQPVVAELICRKGCADAGGDILKLFGGLNMDLVIPATVTGIDVNSLTYLWSFQVYNNTLQQFWDVSEKIEDRVSPGVQVSSTAIQELTDLGLQYFQMSCTVSATGHETTIISKQFVLNLAPYGGSCELKRETGVLVGSSDVQAARDKVCIECSGWKDEETRRNRTDKDGPGSLRYESRQVFLQADNTTDTSSAAVPLASNEHARNCFWLSTTNASRNSLCLIETKILDIYSEPYEMSQTYANVVAPIPEGVSGEEGKELVVEFAASFNVILEGVKATENSQAITSAVSSGGSAVQLEGLEGTPLTEVPSNEFILTLSSGPAEPDPALVEVRKVNVNLTATLLDVPVENFATGIQVIGAVTVLSSGPPANMDSTSQDNLVFTFGKVTERTSDLNLADQSSINYVNALVGATGTMGMMIVKDTLDSTETVSRDLASAEKVFSDTSDANQNETDDELYFIIRQKQKIVELKKNELMNRSKELDRQASELAFNVLNKTQNTISVGVQMTYTGSGSNDAIAVKKNKASQFKNNPITINNVAVYIEFGNVGGEEEVTMALAESSNTLKLDETNRAADANGQVKFVTQTTSQISSFVTVFQLEPVTLSRVEPVIDPEDASAFSYHIALVKSTDDMLCVTTQPASGEVTHYVVWINKPSADTVSKIDFVAKETANQDNAFSVCFSSTQRTSDIGNWRIGIEGIMAVTPVRKRRDTTNETYTVYPAYDFGVITTACMVWDDNTDSWTSSSCDGKWNVTASTLECNCPPQREMTFSNSFYVAPNKIDFSSVFLKFSPLNQAAVMGTLAGVLVIYILVIIWARRNDRKDLLKWGITPLLDNFAEDNYFYVIRVYTGMRPNAGTKSRIGMVIAGEEMDTGIRELYDGVRKVFATGSVQNFLLSTNMYLGELEYMRLWHDNSGGGNYSSWYLSKIEVQDIQRNEIFTFLAEKWLSVDDEDGSLECVLPVAKNDNLNIFRNRFYSNAKSSLAESHIWVSVVYRPMTSNFTRVQRASCALVFVMLTMISNAMYFQSSDDPNYETPAEVQVGPFRFSLQQVYTSLICALITTSATLVVIYLFKMSRNKPQKEAILFKPREQTSEKKYKIPYLDDWLEREHSKSVELEKHLVEKGYPKLEGFYLPYQCRKIAWFLVFATFVICGFFLMLYSMEWGKQKSEEWLTTFFLSFFESVFAMDPVKVAVMALVFAILFRAAGESSMIVDRQTIMRNYAGNQRGKSGGIRLPAPPLDHKRLEEERIIRLRELKMKTAFRDVVIQVFQIWILLSISFSNRDTKSYYMHKELEDSVLEPINKTTFYEIKTVEQYYNWLNNTVIPTIFPEEDYNGDQLHWRLRQFTTGGVNFRVGPPRLRQVRVPKDTCDIPYIGTFDCYETYKTETEETKDYCIGWTPEPCNPEDSVYKFSYDAWQFISAMDIWGLPLSGYYRTYGGGGYISKLSVNREVSQLILKELYDYSWINRQTRAVIFEFTLYCLNVNIFTYNMFMVEFPETGGAFPFAFILPLRVYQHTGAIGKYTLACEVIFLLFLIVMTILAVVGIYKERRAFFSKPWQVYDLVFIIAGYVAVAMYLARILMTHYALEVFREDKKEFVNFYHVAIWDQILVLLIGILVFLAIFRLLNILGYNKRIGAVARVFTNAAGDLLWFGLFFLTIFTCYAVFGYLLFGAELSSYKNVYRTMGTLFISMIGKSRFTEIEDTDPIMSKLYFMVFIFFVVYMILTMFLAILSQSIDKVHTETKNDKGDEMVDYLMKKFKKLLGYGQGGEGHRPRHLSAYPAQPAAPWNMKKGRKFEYDNRQILEDIRMSLTDAMNMDPKEFSTPEPDKKVSKKLRH